MSENIFQMPRTGAAESDPVEETVADKQVRGRSTIEFPYADLSDALAVVSAIQSKGAAPLSRDQLAAAMGQPPNSGSFSAKMHAARQFGLVELLPDGRVKISELGFEAADRDECRSRAARAVAFLNVALFKRAYEEFRNKTLPPRPHGLEQAFVGFGVIEKRKTNARWSFDRSAKQAGFFEGGEDRLIMPVIAEQQRGVVAERVQPTTPAALETNTRKVTPLSAADEPLIQGLLGRLPELGTDWPLKERVRWLRALAVNFGMVYGGVEDNDIMITATSVAAKPPTTSATSATSPRQVAPPASTARNEPERIPSWDAQTRSSDLDDEIPF